MGSTVMIDVGSGPPLVLVPGIQGRWEWMRPAVLALAERFRVLTFTLAGEKTSGHAFNPALGFDNFVVQVDRVLEEAGEPSATVCGVSYGGLVALRYAAMRPYRTRALVLVSALAPSFEPDDRFRFYARAPRLLVPVFCVAACRRGATEVAAALPAWRDRLSFSVGQLGRVAMAPPSPRLMIRRIELLAGVDFESSVRQVVAPTLVVTGDATLDRVVPMDHTREYLDLIPHAEPATLEHTGHLGTVTRPHAFAILVNEFVSRQAAAGPEAPARQAPQQETPQQAVRSRRVAG